VRDRANRVVGYGAWTFAGFWRAIFAGTKVTCFAKKVFWQNRENFAKNTEEKCGTYARIAIAINDFARFGQHYKTGRKQGRKHAEETGITLPPWLERKGKKIAARRRQVFSSTSLLVSSAKAAAHLLRH